MLSMSYSKAIAFLTLALAASASADVIGWGPAQNTTGAANVSTNGTLVVAHNTWSGLATSPTVNGVTFTAFAPPEWSIGASPMMNGSLTGDIGYDALLYGARATSEGTLTNPTGWGGIRLDSLGTFTVGNHYEIQVWFTDQRPGTVGNPLNDRMMKLGSAVGSVTLTAGIVTNLGALTQGAHSGLLDGDPNNASGAGDTIFGQFCIGTFQRTSTAPLYLLVQGSHPISNVTLRPHVSAFQVREVPPPVGTNYCVAAPNSTGVTALISATGSAAVVANDLTLVASRLPLNAFSYFITSRTQAYVAMAGGSQGNLCLGGSIGRGVGGVIVNSGFSGRVSVVANLTSMPTPMGPVAVHVGETWNFQCWSRDSVGGVATSNYTNGLTVTFN